MLRDGRLEDVFALDWINMDGRDRLGQALTGLLCRLDATHKSLGRRERSSCCIRGSKQVESASPQTLSDQSCRHCLQADRRTLPSTYGLSPATAKAGNIVLLHWSYSSLVRRGSVILWQTRANVLDVRICASRGFALVKERQSQFHAVVLGT